MTRKKQILGKLIVMKRRQCSDLFDQHRWRILVLTSMRVNGRWRAIMLPAVYGHALGVLQPELK